MCEEYVTTGNICTIAVFQWVKNFFSRYGARKNFSLIYVFVYEYMKKGGSAPVHFTRQPIFCYGLQLISILDLLNFVEFRLNFWMFIKVSRFWWIFQNFSSKFKRFCQNFLVLPKIWKILSNFADFDEIWHTLSILAHFAKFWILIRKIFAKF